MAASRAAAESRSYTTCALPIDQCTRLPLLLHAGNCPPISVSRFTGTAAVFGSATLTAGCVPRGGTTTVVPQSDISIEEEKGKQFLTLKSGVSLATLVQGLNALGLTPRDMISILQTIKAAGALQAEIEVM